MRTQKMNELLDTYNPLHSPTTKSLAEAHQQLNLQTWQYRQVIASAKNTIKEQQRLLKHAQKQQSKIRSLLRGLACTMHGWNSIETSTEIVPY